MSRVGLLEDNGTIARLTATMLTYVGHEVIIFERPSDCLDALHLAEAKLAGLPASIRASLPVELLILDLHLPEVNGLYILELLRSQPHTRSLPLIFFTAATDPIIKQAFQLAPQAQLVEKPFKMEELLNAVSVALDKGTIAEIP